MVKMMIIQWNWVYPTLRQTQWLCPSDRIMLLRILKLRTWCQCLHVGKRSEHSMFVIYLRKSCSTLLLLVDNSTRRCCFIRSQHCFDQSTIFAYIIWLSHVKSPQKACPVVASIQLLFVKSVLSASSKTDKVPKFFLVPSLFLCLLKFTFMPIVDQSPTFAGIISAAEQIPLDEQSSMPGPLNWGWRPMKSPLVDQWQMKTIHCI